MIFNRRSGSFGGFGSLSPFGGGTGGFGKYGIGAAPGDVGQTADQVAAYEAYVAAVGWQNGQVSDAAYLASLATAAAGATPGTQAAVSAQNKLEDASYTIARNEYVATVNNAGDTASRVAALQQLIAFDQSHLAGMTPDNEQYRELEGRILGLQADVRQTQYGDLVERYNSGLATTDDLLAFARNALGETAGTGDATTWQRTLASLVDRQKQEKLTGLYQDYQQGRITASDLLGALQTHLSEVNADSPDGQDLRRRIEDLTAQEAQRVKNAAAQKLYEDFQGGKISDASYLLRLKRAVDAEGPGTVARHEAEQRFAAASFSLAEDKLRYEIARGSKTAVASLVSLYRSYQATMNPGSKQFRDLQLSIDRLKSSGSGGGVSKGTKADLAWVAGTKKLTALPPGFEVHPGLDVNGKKLPKGALAALFAVDGSKATQRSWFALNLGNARDAQLHGADRMLFVPPGSAVSYQIDFRPSMLVQLERANVKMEQVAVTLAQNGPPKTLTAAWRRLATASKDLRDAQTQLLYEDFADRMKDLKLAQAQALTRQDFASYMNMTAEMAATVGDLAGRPMGTIESQPFLATGEPNPAYAPLDLSASGLTTDQQATVLAIANAISPRVGDQMNPNFNPDGDPLLELMANQQEGQPAIWARDLAGQGSYTASGFDRNQVFFQQLTEGARAGQVVAVTRLNNPDLFVMVPTTNPDGSEGPTTPAYMAPGSGRIVVQLPPTYTPGSAAGQTVEQMAAARRQIPGTFLVSPEVSQPVEVRSGLTRVKATIGPPTGVPGRAAGYGGVRSPSQETISDISLDVQTVAGFEGRKRVLWVSLDGKNWLRMADIAYERDPKTGELVPVPGGPAAPTIVLDPRIRVRRDPKTGALVFTAPAGMVLTNPGQFGSSHFWNDNDATSISQLGTGAPGADLLTATTDAAGSLRVSAPRPEREIVDPQDYDPQTGQALVDSKGRPVSLATWKAYRAGTAPAQLAAKGRRIGAPGLVTKTEFERNLDILPPVGQPEPSMRGRGEGGLAESGIVAPAAKPRPPVSEALARAWEFGPGSSELPWGARPRPQSQVYPRPVYPAPSRTELRPVSTAPTPIVAQLPIMSLQPGNLDSLALPTLKPLPTVNLPPLSKLTIPTSPVGGRGLNPLYQPVTASTKPTPSGEVAYKAPSLTPTKL